MKRAMTFRLMLASSLLMLFLSGCILQLPAPYIEINLEPAYNDTEILIPFRIEGEGSYARARWRLRAYDAVPGDYIEEREIRIPSGGSGVLQLGQLPEYRFEIEFSLLTTRDGSFEVVPYLTKSGQFFVDRTVPPGPPAPVYYDDTNAAYGPPPFMTSETTVEFTLPGQAPWESPLRVLAVLDDYRPLVSGQDEVPIAPERWRIYDGSTPPANMTYVIIDAAGNRTEVFVENY